ncbi:hypothetical protein M569_00277, partial [Genlisea aurea]
EMGFPAFPYDPYSIQTDFMKFLYQSLERGGISMLESPTGTGKTLSVICSALQWLVDKKNLENAVGNESEKLEKADQDGDDPDWMRNFVPNKEINIARRNASVSKRNNGFYSKDKEAKCRAEFISKEKEKASGDEELINREETGNGADRDVLDVGEFLLEDYDSEEEKCAKSKRKSVGGDDDFSSEEDGDGFELEEEDTGTKVYFCSRTHSQLAQFMKELRKTRFSDELKIASLGSRKIFCINEGVLKLRALAHINEKCLELQKHRTNKDRAAKAKASSCGCPMLSKRKVEEFVDEVTRVQAMDIEDIVHIGRSLGSCPYYGSRRMMRSADLVVLPYQSLLSKSSRESLGLRLKDSIVIIDEAHNLADALINMYDAKISLPQLKKLRSHLEQYSQRFSNLLGPGNRRYIQILKILVQAFIRTLCEDMEVPGERGSPSRFVMSINEFLFALNIDNINLIKLSQYMKESHIIYKASFFMYVTGYGDKLAASEEEAPTVGDCKEDSDDETAITGFRAFASILSSLTNNNSAGKVIISRPHETSNGLEEGYIKYVMLTGEKIFSEITDQAHAVILVGGTLQPIEETRERLFPSIELNQLRFFSCNHIIPPENILPIAVKNGPSGKCLDFSYKMRSSSTMIGELGLLLCNLVSVVPEGMVVFFSSFDYENQVYTSWQKSGILSRIMKKKKVFREPRKSTDIEAVLKKYKETIDSCHSGAIILAVVGGKISEGINFSDGAGRCIVMVGLPYSSPSDIELIERVKHIEGVEMKACTKKFDHSIDIECEEVDQDTGFHMLRSCRGRGRDYYENLCMKAVNQCIGRAIRHVKDYAAILLVDGRYCCDERSSSRSGHPTEKLPQWIRQQLVATSSNYGQVQKLVQQFFRSH